MYKVLERYFEPDPALVNFCGKGIAAGKKKFGYSAGEAGAWLLGILVDHLDNIITGFGFSYTFCDAEVALNDKFLSLGGIKEKGMSAFIPQSAKAEQIKAMTKCKWIPNDNYWKGVSLGSVQSKEICEKNYLYSIIKINRNFL